MNTTSIETKTFIGQRIRQARAIAGISQDALGKALGKTFQQIQKYESAANRTSANVLLEIANITGREITFFFPDEDNRDKTNQHYSNKMKTLIKNCKGLDDKSLKLINRLAMDMHEHQS